MQPIGSNLGFNVSPKDTLTRGQFELRLEPLTLQSLHNLPQKAKVWIFQTICTLLLTRGLELWVLTQAVDDESILRERMRSSDTQDQLGVGLLLLRIKRSQLSCCRCPLEKACPTGRRPMRRSRIRWRDCVSLLARERLGMLLEEPA